VSEDWLNRAACRLSNDPEAAFAKDPSPELEKFRTEFCRWCPVTVECLRVALDRELDLSAGHRHGVWGGLTPDERARYARMGRRECADCRRGFIPVQASQVRCSGCAKPKPAPRPEVVREHGTRAGYLQHRRRREPACAGCLTAQTRHTRSRRVEAGAATVPATAEVERLADCGTHAGYVRHRAAGEVPCVDCADANTVYNRIAKRISRMAKRLRGAA